MRVKQFWYVSFCLMMSSAQDRLTGLALSESRNLNWATTAFYYSALHAGRLLCFICCGDFPTSHAKLADLLAPTQERPPHPHRPGFHFDWLDRFLRYTRVNSLNSRNPNVRGHDQDWGKLIEAIDATLPGLRADFDRFAPLLAKFKNLRNDCNYEALLVAHEWNHHVTDLDSPEDRGVTRGFSDLVEAADRVSRLGVDLAIDAYLTHLKNADCFAADRENHHAAHSKYLRDRFGPSLTHKFQASNEAKKELQRMMERLNWPDAQPCQDLDTFLESIRYDIFGEKQGLMQRWRADIHGLRRQLDCEEPPTGPS